MDERLTKQEFKRRYLINLRSYLPLEFKDVTIFMRLVKKKELGDAKLYMDTEISSVRTVTHEGFTWRVETRKPIWGISEMMLLAHYKTAEVSWDYKGKEKNERRI